MKTYSFTLTWIVLICVLGHGLVESFSFDLSQAVDQIRKSVVKKAAEPHLRDTALRFIPPYVRQFQQDRDTNTPWKVSNPGKNLNPFSSLLLHGAPLVKRPSSTSMSEDSNKLSAPFKWISCGSSPQIMEIKSLSVKPDPVSFPGRISFSFDIEFHESISSSENLTVALDVYMKSNDNWLRLPCLGFIGSCTYVDFCQLIAGNTCPQEFTAQGVPCKCPFNKGNYKLSDYTVEILAEVLIPGDYKTKVQVSSDKKGEIACYEIYVTDE